MYVSEQKLYTGLCVCLCTYYVNKVHLYDLKGNRSVASFLCYILCNNMSKYKVLDQKSKTVCVFSTLQQLVTCRSSLSHRSHICIVRLSGWCIFCFSRWHLFLGTAMFTPVRTKYFAVCLCVWPSVCLSIFPLSMFIYKRLLSLDGLELSVKLILMDCFSIICLSISLSIPNNSSTGKQDVFPYKLFFLGVSANQL